jgi:hypothetical protein
VFRASFSRISRGGELIRTLARAELPFHRLLGSTIKMATRPAHTAFPGLTGNIIRTNPDG